MINPLLYKNEYYTNMNRLYRAVSITTRYPLPLYCFSDFPFSAKKLYPKAGLSSQGARNPRQRRYQESSTRMEEHSSRAKRCCSTVIVYQNPGQRIGRTPKMLGDDVASVWDLPRALLLPEQIAIRLNKQKVSICRKLFGVLLTVNS